MSVNAYMADVTSAEHRTKRIAFMTGLWPIGFNVGKACSGVIKTKLGFMYNFRQGVEGGRGTGNNGNKRAGMMHLHFRNDFLFDSGLKLSFLCNVWTGNILNKKKLRLFDYSRQL